ncbi:hypothetical protein B5X24_HaOG202624 [Helicoverpa armigera]|uniref:Reverse transcriptase domain-containing protein n=1 Tax=Helicoverpa armigera TaxID=29058 RepID=A0A2W1BSQ8_HELAM|nr:hypothetical protein B5X24_HaOG202624 [Helicoverpa armigera]
MFPVAILPYREDAQAQTREFLSRVVDVLLDFVHQVNDRNEKILEFKMPEEMNKMLDFQLHDEPLPLKQLLEDCKVALKHQVKTEHNSIWQCLKKQGVDQKYIRILKSIYTNSTARIKLEKQGKQININRGVRQGDPLSPKLFTVVLEDIFRRLEWDHYGLNINGENLTHLRFADDIIILARSKDQLQYMITDLDRESRKVGLTMNTSKTKAMTNALEDTILLNAEPVEFVKEYTYLGQQISVTDIMTKEIDTRIGNAWKRYWGFKEIMKNTEIKTYVKTKLYNTCILPVLTYGCETWALTKALYKKLETCQTAMQRSMLNIRKSDRIRNTTIRRRMKIENVTTRIRKLKWKWSGHIVRGNDKWNKNIISWYPRDKKRNRGRQYRRWDDEIKSIAGNIWTRRAQNRAEWKKMEEAFAKVGQTDQVVGVINSSEL